MVEQQKRLAVMALWQQGKSKKQIARLLGLDVKTVRAIIAAQGKQRPPISRARALPPLDALAELYRRCDGYVHRMHEVLLEEQGFKIGYSTLTRAIRRLGLDKKDKVRPAAHVPDVPGQEMQHDTTVYSLALGDHPAVKIVCSGLYLRYSKMRYIKFYHSFNRFHMKCFLDEALRFFGYSAHTCIIDNTSLAVFGGCGADALFAPEMVAFANNYGFRWVAHALGHANRKAGTERNFWTVETSFIPGRRFVSLEDLNTQALQWATQRYARRPQSHTGLVPIELFEHEKQFLHKLPDYITPPTLAHKRTLDAYCYIRFDANFYWIPADPHTDVSVVQYAGEIVIFHRPDQELIRYLLPPDGVKKQIFAPKDKPGTRGQPRNLKKGCDEQERLLRQRGDAVRAYLDYIRSADCLIRYKPHFIRQLFDLSRTCDDQLFLPLVQQALSFRVRSINVLLRMAVQLSQTLSPSLQIPQIQPSQSTDDLAQRPAYRQGEFCHENDPQSLLDNNNQPSGDNHGPTTA